MKNKLKQIESILKNTCNWLGTVDETTNSILCEGCVHYDDEEGYCKAYNTNEAMKEIHNLINEGKINHA